MPPVLAAAVRHVAASDCEAIGRHLIAQPANTVSSLAYVVVGGLLWARAGRVAAERRGRARAVAAALLAVGVGSVAFHGPGGPVAHWVHDAAIVALALAVLLRPARPSFLVRNVPESGTERTRNGWPGHAWLVAASVLGAAALLALVPSAGNALAAPALIAALATRARDRTGRVGAAPAGLALLAGGFVLGSLSRTGQPLCEPAALLQGHAAWHLLSAAGLGLLAVALDGVAARPARRARPARSTETPVLVAAR